jgi:predicted RNase H-like nuclease
MTAILGIDAAWTNSEPSGVALVCSTSKGWRSVAVAPSYEMFVALSADKKVSWDQTPIRGSAPNIPRLLAAAKKLAGEKVKIVTLDIPFSTAPITGRRVADNAISKEFGGRGCSAHSPNETRPGKVGTDISGALNASGYSLVCGSSVDSNSQCYLEVYPHPALLSLLQKEYRITYKVSKSKKYWPGADVKQRVTNLLLEFQNIYVALESVFGDLGFALPKPKAVPTMAFLKRYEDVLDALVCPWVGVLFVGSETMPLGDETAAIWCPKDVVINQSRDRR